MQEEKLEEVVEVWLQKEQIEGEEYIVLRAKHPETSMKWRILGICPNKPIRRFPCLPRELGFKTNPIGEVTIE